MVVITACASRQGVIFATLSGLIWQSAPRAWIGYLVCSETILQQQPGNSETPQIQWKSSVHRLNHITTGSASQQAKPHV